MSNSMTKMKKKLEHWEIVSLLLMVYDFTAILVSYLQHCGFGLTVNLAESRKTICRHIFTQHGFMQYSA